MSCHEQEENLREEVRISQMVGSHGNIVYMKEFVENKVPSSSLRYYSPA